MRVKLHRLWLLGHLVLQYMFFSLPNFLLGQKFDVVIYGGTSSAIVAAVQVKRMGKSVAVVSPDSRLGGMSSNGLGSSDIGKQDVIGGIAREFYHRIWRHYQSPDAWKWQEIEDFGNRGQGSPILDKSRRTMWVFEPHVASEIFESWIKENEINVFRDEWLDRESGVEMKEGRIISITTLSGNRYEGNIFIDCSYEGDLMASAGVSYFIGREANTHYGESMNGVEIKYSKRHQFINRIDPFQIPGDRRSGILAHINKQASGTDGSEDKKMQAYNFRLCMTKVPENRVPLSEPEGYDKSEYELLLRVLNHASSHKIVHFDPIPNGKTDTKNYGSFSTNNIGKNYEYPDGSYGKRQQIIEEHFRYQMGFFYFLSNDPRVPDEVRREMNQWGLSRDEFMENNHWPLQLYIREARRMVSDFVLTEHEVSGRRKSVNSVGMSSYSMESQHVQRIITSDEAGNSYVLNEGDFKVTSKEPFALPYESLVPRKNECLNLLVPVCLSASHVAFGSILREPIIMILGQSAATAAVLSIDLNCSVQDLPYEILGARLMEDGQILELKKNYRITKAKGVSVASLGGVLVDGSSIELTGDWTESTSLRPFVGNSYYHDGNGGKGLCTAKFSFIASANGLHEIKISFSSFGNRAGNILYTVNHLEGTTKVYVDQRKPSPIGELWSSLGTFNFKKGELYSVFVKNENTEGYVVVDALQVIALNNEDD